jgi:hypothetical protein
MEDKEVSITLKITQWNVVMQGLGQLPYFQAVALIDELKRQADSQLNATIEPPQNPS